MDLLKSHKPIIAAFVFIAILGMANGMYQKHMIHECLSSGGAVTSIQGHPSWVCIPRSSR